ncbi:DNA recombination protein RmuC [Thiomicrorhabdus sp. ZW0627]|uniref:DNA recombination protein RmuC n=1 Tax=Thiomicrorhabdus sp. ZW0627 TaxID=3039774 RepID=UPI002436572C|nr:DNA recombination protein RmuC [Thiomicrorhabdus sp. ZW0627]MDG6773945.1 DNA recombination protein RmuC [Thiomicrorhabdus sp. ZW0627]
MALLGSTGGVAILYLIYSRFSLKSKLDRLSIENASQQEQLKSMEALAESQQKLQQRVSELQPLEGSVIQLERQLENLQNVLQQKETSLLELQERNNQLRETSAELTSRLENEKQNAQEKIQLLEEAKQQLANEFKVLANQIFESKQSQFNEHSKQSVESVLKPMQAALESFKQRVETAHKEDIEGRASLTEQLKQLQSLNSKMTEEAQNLTQALKGDSKTQGNWGELILERLLERSGLREGVEFDREKSFVNDEGKRQRPDVVINLPDNKHIVIDSKVSLLHYEKALNSDSEVEKQTALKQHLSSLKNHIDTLAAKRYEHLERLNAPDFVLMFVPVEGAYMMAIEADPSVFENAFEKRVAVVTPTTLFTTLKTIEQLWRYERQSENTLQLIKRAAEVHDKFVGFVETFEKVGKQLDTAQSTYQTARKQMMSGSGNLVRQAEMLKELAGKTRKEIPEHLLEEAEGGMDVQTEISSKV